MWDSSVEERLVRAFTHRVRYYETDAQRIVFNMWFLAWCDEALAAWMTTIGLPYEELLLRGLDMQVVRAELDFSAPLAPGDETDVFVGCGHVGNSSFVMLFDIRHAGSTAARVATTYVMIGTDGTGSTKVPDDIRLMFLSPVEADA